MIIRLRWSLLAICGAVFLLAAGSPVSGNEQRTITKNLSDIRMTVIPGAPTCFVAAVEQGDPSKEPSIMIMRGERGCAVPWHWHPSTENIMLIKGTARAEMKDTGPVTLKGGGYLSVPPQHPMTFSCLTRCELFLSTDGPFEIHYIDDNGKEISAEEALRTVKKK